MSKKGSYWHNIKSTTSTLGAGLKLTMRHLKDARKSREPMSPKNENYFDRQTGIMTTQYPKEVIPVPHNGRYKLDCEIDDCIVCDKCAKVCPVDCIDIEPVRAVDEFGKTSDGTPKRIYAAKFDIDMAKCCFCGLCTVVCPTECLTMTDEYDFSGFDFTEHNFAFAEMTPLEILEKKQAFEKFSAEKEAAKQAAATSAVPGTSKPRIPIKPKVRGGSTPVQQSETEKAEEPKTFRPKVPMKPRVPKPKGNDGDAQNPENE